MNQNSKIQYYNNQYNSMFDDSESNDELQDSVKDSHKKLNTALSETNGPELFHCILNMMNDHDKSHKSDKYLTQIELNKIKNIYCSNFVDSGYFEKFNPKNGDYSIIFKYLKNINLLQSCCFCGCHYLKEITIPKSITSIGFSSFTNCENLKTISIPNSVTYIGYFCFSNCYSLQCS